jgi:hypothetical protein
MRKLIALLAFVAAAGCGSDSPTNPASASISGTFSLHTINGSALPYTFQSGTTSVTITSDVITVADGGTWSEVGNFTVTQNGASTPQTFSDGGSWTRAGTSVSFFSTAQNATSYAGTFTGSGFDLSDSSFTYSFTK